MCYHVIPFVFTLLYNPFCVYIIIGHNKIKKKFLRSGPALSGQCLPSHRPGHGRRSHRRSPPAWPQRRLGVRVSLPGWADSESTCRVGDSDSSHRAGPGSAVGATVRPQAPTAGPGQPGRGLVAETWHMMTSGSDSESLRLAAAA